MTLSIRYSVEADSFLDAMTKAAAMVRTGCRIEGVVEASHIGRSWTIVLRVHEDV